jgi:hypothetical protein
MGEHVLCAATARNSAVRPVYALHVDAGVKQASRFTGVRCAAFETEIVRCAAKVSP